MRYRKVPDETVRRLPLYLRGLLLSLHQGRLCISSQELADLVGVRPWQVRKDFSHFGGFGTPGVGYDTKKLARQIKNILKLGVIQKVALVGVGNVGSAILSYPGFAMYSFDVVAAFDIDHSKIGRKVNNILIEDVSNLATLKHRKINLAILAVPADAAQQTADTLANAGIKGILKFSPCYITVPKKVKVISIDIATDLARLPYYIRAGRIND